MTDPSRLAAVLPGLSWPNTGVNSKDPVFIAINALAESIAVFAVLDGRKRIVELGRFPIPSIDGENHRWDEGVCSFSDDGTNGLAGSEAFHGVIWVQTRVGTWRTHLVNHDDRSVPYLEGIAIRGHTLYAIERNGSVWIADNIDSPPRGPDTTRIARRVLLPAIVAHPQDLAWDEDRKRWWIASESASAILPKEYFSGWVAFVRRVAAYHLNATVALILIETTLLLREVNRQRRYREFKSDV